MDGFDEDARYMTGACRSGVWRSARVAREAAAASGGGTGSPGDDDDSQHPSGACVPSSTRTPHQHHPCSPASVPQPSCPHFRTRGLRVGTMNGVHAQCCAIARMDGLASPNVCACRRRGRERRFLIPPSRTHSLRAAGYERPCMHGSGVWVPLGSPEWAPSREVESTSCITVENPRARCSATPRLFPSAPSGDSRQADG